MSHFARVTSLKLLLCACALGATWHGVLRDEQGNPLPRSKVAVRRNPEVVRTTTTDQNGKFTFEDLSEGSYSVSVGSQRRSASLQVEVPAGDLDLSLKLAAPDHLVPLASDAAEAGTPQRLSSQKVSALPLNKRDFSQILLLASATT